LLLAAAERIGAMVVTVDQTDPVELLSGAFVIFC
jgi:hypothetical protein